MLVRRSEGSPFGGWRGKPWLPTVAESSGALQMGTGFRVQGSHDVRRQLSEYLGSRKELMNLLARIVSVNPKRVQGLGFRGLGFRVQVVSINSLDPNPLNA